MFNKILKKTNKKAFNIILQANLMKKVVSRFIELVTKTPQNINLTLKLAKYVSARQIKFE